MSKNFRRIALLAIFLASAPALATNGYWSHGYGPKSKSVAGACVAMAFGAMCAATNPGSLAVVGNRLEFGAALFAPTRGFVADDVPSSGNPIPVGSYESENDLFLIPHFAYNRMLDDKSSIGIAVGGNGGMNTEYDAAVFRNFAPPGVTSSPTGIDMKQVFAGITYSRKLNDQHSIGITPVLAVQSFKAEGLEPFTVGGAFAVSTAPTKVTNKGTDISYGGGLKLGWLWQVNDRLNIGAAYQSRLYMTRFDDYAGLFAEQGDFDIPSNLDLGFAYKMTPELTFAFNYQRINFAEVRAIGNRADIPLTTGSLGCDDCLGFGWDDVNIYKFGLQWQYRPDLAFRAGFSYATDAFEGSQALFNILAPAVVKRHFTFGIGKKLPGGSEINLAFAYMPEDRVHGTNVNTGGPAGQTGHLFMDQWELEIGWATAF